MKTVMRLLLAAAGGAIVGYVCARSAPPELPIAVDFVATAKDFAKVASKVDIGDGQDYTYALDDSLFVDTPRWPSDAENPPLAARDAIVVGDRIIEQFTEKQNGMTPELDWKPELDELSLKSFGPHWYWSVTYVWFPANGGLRGVPPYAQVFVRMDGTAIPYETRPHKDN